MSVVKETSYKALIITMVTVTSAKMKILLPLVVILGIFMIIDIIYGVKATIYESKHNIKSGQVSSETLIERFVTKLGRLLLIVVGLFIDVGIMYGAELVGSTVEIQPIFALVVVVALLGQELFSITENYTRCGNTPPKWMGALGEALQKSAESKGDRYVKQIEKELDDIDE